MNTDEHGCGFDKEARNAGEAEAKPVSFLSSWSPDFESAFDPCFVWD
jgi:hypothetical protein